MLRIFCWISTIINSIADGNSKSELLWKETFFANQKLNEIKNIKAGNIFESNVLSQSGGNSKL